MNPKVSIVVPIYNVEKYLNRCIESIVNQTYTNLEIILVDDGSPDNCPAMCDEWAQKDERIKVIHKENAGLGMARNTGIDHATGKYIFFLDSDDYVDVTIVQKCVENAEEYNSEVVIYGRYDVHEDGTISAQAIRPTQNIFKGQSIQAELLPAMFTYDMGFGISAWGKMYRVDVFLNQNIRFLSEREIISEDAYFALEFFSKISVVTVVDENLYYYYKRNTSLSRVYREDRQTKNDIFIKKSLIYIQDHLPKAVMLHVIARYHMYTIAAMKQILEADLSMVKKIGEVNKILKNQTLHSTIDQDVLCIQKRSLRIFFKLIKWRCYPLCIVLLYLKTKK